MRDRQDGATHATDWQAGPCFACDGVARRGSTRQARQGKVSRAMARQASLVLQWRDGAGKAWDNPARRGAARHGRQGATGSDCKGLARHDRHGTVHPHGLCGSRRSHRMQDDPARAGRKPALADGAARQVRPGYARPGNPGLGKAGEERLGATRQDCDRRGRQGTATQAGAWFGRHGMKSHGLELQDKAGAARLD